MSDSLKMPGATGIYTGITTSSLANRKGAKSDKEKVATDFEAYFIFTMLKEMGKSINTSKKGFMNETYMSAMYEKLGEQLAGKGAGIKEAIMRYMERAETKVPAQKSDNMTSEDPIPQSVSSDPGGSEGL